MTTTPDPLYAPVYAKYATGDYHTPTPAPVEHPVARAVRSHGSRLTLTDPAGKKHTVSSVLPGGHTATHVVFSRYSSWPADTWSFTRRASPQSIRQDTVGRYARPNAVLVEITDAWEPDYAKVVDLIEDTITKATKEGASEEVQALLNQALMNAAADYQAAQAPAQ